MRPNHEFVGRYIGISVLSELVGRGGKGREGKSWWGTPKAMNATIN